MIKVLFVDYIHLKIISCVPKALLAYMNLESFNHVFKYNPSLKSKQKNDKILYFRRSWLQSADGFQESESEAQRTLIWQHPR